MGFLKFFLLLIILMFTLGSLWALSWERKKKIAVETSEEKLVREARESRSRALQTLFTGILLVGVVVWDILAHFQTAKNYGIAISTRTLIGEGLLAIGFLLFGLILWWREKRLG